MTGGRNKDQQPPEIKIGMGIHWWRIEKKKKEKNNRQLRRTNRRPSGR